MEKHYVCPECSGVSNVPAQCTTEGCHLHGTALKECSCTDGTHQMVLNVNA